MKALRPLAVWGLSILVILSAVTFLFTHEASEDVVITGDIDKATIEGPGGRAWDYLQDGVYTRLEIEVDGFEEVIPFEHDPFAPLNETIDLFCDKECHEYIWDLDEPERKEVYSKVDLGTIAKDLRDHRNRGNVCTLHIIFLVGSTVDEDIAGYTIDASTIFVFAEDLLHPFIGSILAHEFGHLIGAVGILGPDSGYYPEEIDDHLAGHHHCTDDGCYMYVYAGLCGHWCEECKRDILYLKGTECPYTIGGNKLLKPLFGAIAFPGLAILSATAIMILVVINLAGGRSEG